MNRDILRNTIIGYIPNWLRWVLFIPIAGIISLIVLNFTAFIVELADLHTKAVFVSLAFQMAITVPIGIFVASIIAPRTQARVALILGIIAASFALLILVISLLIASSESENAEQWWVFVPTAVTVMIISFIPTAVIQKVNKKHPR